MSRIACVALINSGGNCTWRQALIGDALRLCPGLSGVYTFVGVVTPPTRNNCGTVKVENPFGNFQLTFFSSLFADLLLLNVEVPEDAETEFSLPIIERNTGWEVLKPGDIVIECATYGPEREWEFVQFLPPELPGTGPSFLWKNLTDGQDCTIDEGQSRQYFHTQVVAMNTVTDQ